MPPGAAGRFRPRAVLVVAAAMFVGVATSAGAATGQASVYGRKFDGRRTASGERFDPSKLTAAHKTLPLGTRVRVRNLATGRSVVVRVNDRGRLAPGRIIDLSPAAARAIGMDTRGVARVEVVRVANARDDRGEDAGGARNAAAGGETVPAD